MAQTLIRGSTQILDASIPTTKLVAGWDTPFVKRDGSVALTADWGVGNFKVTGIADATNPTDAVSLRVLQSFESGMGLRANARTVAVSNVALTGVQNFDGITGAAGDVVMLTAQTTPSQNGFWTMNAGAWTRPSFWAAASTQRPALAFITEGTTYDNTKWTTTTNGLITVDTTSVTITQDTSGVTYTNGNGLSLTGNTFAAKVGNGVSFDGSQNITLTPDPVGLLSVGASGIRVAAGTPGQVPIVNGSNNLAYFAMSGNVTISATGVTTVDNSAATGFKKFTNSVNSEIPAGAINGVNTAFTLAFAPVAGTESVYVRGIRQERGAGNDYTIAGAAITMLYVLQTGDKIIVDYVKP